MTLSEARAKYAQALKEGKNESYWKAILYDKLERTMTYAEGAEKAALRKEIFSL